MFVPPGFTPEEWNAVERFLDRHTRDDGSFDIEGANREAAMNAARRGKLMNKAYSGRRLATGETTVVVIPDGKTGEAYHLDPRLDLRNHSPTGFEWGYAGSGPSQLALALLADALTAPLPKAAAEAVAMHNYIEFKFDRVALWPQNEDWRISQGEICAWVEAREKERARAASDHGHHHGGEIIAAALREGRPYLGFSIRRDETIDHCFFGNLSSYGAFFQNLVEHAIKYNDDFSHSCPVCQAHLEALKAARESYLAVMHAKIGDKQKCH